MASAVGGTQESVGPGEAPAGLFATGHGISEKTAESWVVADLDLVNLRELQQVAGIERGSSGLVSRLYAIDGPGFVRRLRGAFSIAVWDRSRRQLLLAVDHFGMRRMHYATSARGTAFSSRLGALLADRVASREVSPDAVYSYLNFRFIPSPETPFTGIRRLPPGHSLLIGPGYSKIEPFWDMKYAEEPSPADRAASSVFRLTHQAVREALDDLPPEECGAFLSGGTDSSTVVGLMTHVTGERVNAFSIGFLSDRYDELSYAGLTARHFNAKHYRRVITPEDALGALPNLVAAYDEPFGNNSALGTLFCAQMARDTGVKHLLAGDGGDEIFGGNERYRTDRIFSRYGRLPAALRRGLLEPILLRLPETTPGVLGRARRYVRRALIPNPQRFYSYEFYVAQNAARLLHPDLVGAITVEAPSATLVRHFHQVEASSELNRLLYLDLKLTLGDNDLLKVSRTAELAGIGVRFPLLALPLVEFTGSLPADFKVRGLEKRYLFKRAFRSLLPPQTLTKKKQGFGVPTGEWIKSHAGFRELAHDTLLSSRAAQRGYFRPGALEELFALHLADATPFYGDLLWTILMLELWQRRHVDRAGAA
jgi:asparagine synthase (glutamine-hydrolysing)